MQPLHARLTKRWNAEPLILRIRTNPHRPAGPHDALLIASADEVPADGFGAYVIASDVAPGIAAGLDYLPNACQLPIALNYLADGDIIRLNPRGGEVWVMYRKESRFNSMLLTEQCNSNCLMCSQPPKAANDRYLMEAYRQAIPLMDPDTVELGITGGEPTLLGDDLLSVLADCREHLPRTGMHMLSNGRMFAYPRFCQALAKVGHPNLVLGIPVYSDLAREHDYVVQAAGAFDQTLRGLVNLERFGLRIEVRVVLHRQTVPRLQQLARFIARNLPFVEHVALMGLELTGYVRGNLDALWIDPVDYQEQLRDAVQILNEQRLNVSIYNHQLCVLDEVLWPFARKSISDWKNEYVDACHECSVLHECGGFFASSKLRMSRGIRPVLTVSMSSGSGA